MAAEVESGVFNQERGLPWHGLGTPNDGFLTAHELLCAAGLAWDVEKRELYITDVAGDLVEVPDQFAVVRMTDDKPLGVVGNRYVPAQNDEVLSFMDNIIGSGQAAYDTAWSLRGGKTVAITAELGQRKPVAEGEEYRTYLTAMNTHDGSGKIRIVTSCVRVVCMNTLALALKSAKMTWERKHTMNALAPASVAEAREALALAAEYQDFIDRTAKELLSAKYTSKQFQELAKQLIIGKQETDEIATRTQNKFDELVAMYNNSENIDNIRGTKWGALNAVIEFVDYKGDYRGDDKEDKRAENIMLGRGVGMKTAAYELLAA